MTLSKSICTMGHRPGISRDDYRNYYENNHAPLAIRHFPFRRYVRNHLVTEPDIGFDSISEFWSDDMTAAAALMEGPIGDVMRADERNFIDQPRIAPAGSDEEILSEGEKTSGDGRRFASLLTFAGDAGPVLRWAKAIAARMPGVSIDRVTSWSAEAFPADAVLWTPERPEVDPPAGVSMRVLEVRRMETPPEVMERARAG